VGLTQHSEQKTNRALSSSYVRQPFVVCPNHLGHLAAAAATCFIRIPHHHLFNPALTALCVVTQRPSLTEVISFVLKICFALFCCCLGDMHIRSHKFMRNLHLSLLALTDYRTTRERDKAWTLHLLQFWKGMYSVLNAVALA
jgi:hypothetical protein